MSYRVSVIVEAYNEEQNALGEHPEVIEHLLRQNFPLDQVELLLIGGHAQLAEWKPQPQWKPFGRVRLEAMPEDYTHYWAQKNFGAETAAGKILAYVDSDVIPEPTWLASIVQAIEGGADASVGPSLYRSKDFHSHSPVMLALASISWGFVLDFASKPEHPRAASLLSHNFGIRRDVALGLPFVPSHRSFNSSVLFFDLKQRGIHVAYSPLQRAAHGVDFGWWIRRRHFRTGWETYEGRASHPLWPRLRWLEKMKWVEPLVLRGGMVARDVRHWFRFRRVAGESALLAWLMLPLVLAASLVARAAEAAGMYAFLIAPGAMPRTARF